MKHDRQYPAEPFHRPGFPRLAVVLMDAGYKTPKGNAHWWSAQVRQLLDGRFDDYYGQSSQVPLLRDGFSPDRRGLDLAIDREA